MPRNCVVFLLPRRQTRSAIYGSQIFLVGYQNTKVLPSGLPGGMRANHVMVFEWRERSHRLYAKSCFGFWVTWEVTSIPKTEQNTCFIRLLEQDLNMTVLYKLSYRYLVSSSLFNPKLFNLFPSQFDLRFIAFFFKKGNKIFNIQNSLCIWMRSDAI